MNRSITTLGLLALAATTQLSALTLTFSDRATWLAQVSGVSNFDGGTQAVGTATPFNTSAGLYSTDLQTQIVGYNVNNTTSGILYDLTRANGSAGQPWYSLWNSGTILRTGDKTDNNTVYARILFSSPVNAFGFNYGAGGMSGAAGSVSIATQGLSSLAVTTLPGTFAFYGVASDTQTFSYVDIFIQDTNRYVVLDDIARAIYTVSTPPPTTDTPEAGTLLQLAIGTALVAFARRRYSKAI